VILSTVDGLLDSKGSVVPNVERVDAAVRAMDQGTKSERGTGGMASKLEAVHMATHAGDGAIIASGAEPNVLIRLMRGESLGTFFAPKPRRTRSRKRWFAARTARGTLVVDRGARDALVQRGKSLLPSGIRSASGAFKAGDTVRIADEDGAVFALGMTNLSSEDLGRVCGKKSAQVLRLLGDGAYVEAVHRDNMWVHES